MVGADKKSMIAMIKKIFFELESSNRKVWHLTEYQPPLQLLNRQDWNGVHFTEDIQLKLGSNRETSCVFAITTEDHPIEDGKIQFFGRDLNEIPPTEPCIPFAMVVVTGKPSINFKGLDSESILILNNEIFDFSLQSNPKTLLYRIGNQLYAENITFKDIAFAFWSLFQEKSIAVEIFMATGNQALISRLNIIKEELRTKKRDKLKQRVFAKSQKLRELCESTTDCDICENLPVCTEIMKIQQRRREIRNGRKINETPQ